MDPNAVIFDISSDEEVGCGENRGFGGGDDFGWISKLLDEVDEETDDVDDVVLVSEVVLNPKQRLKSAAKSLVNDVDDDCVLLDGDPDKPVEIENNTGGDSDDLLVVSEKGQVACRDYPHPRHLCAKFPFTSTPHERHCDQCHCYVCDSLAPCVHWGTGVSNIDHCHATEKEELWKLQRNCSKNSDKPSLPVSEAPNNCVSIGLPQMSQVPPSTLLEPNNACSMSTDFGIPNIFNQIRSQRYGYGVPRTKIQPNLAVSQQLLSARNNIIRRGRRHNVGTLPPQYISSRAPLKRAGSIGGALTTNRCGYSSSNNNHGSQYSRNPPPVATPSNKNPISRWQDFHGGMIPELNIYGISSQPNMGSIGVNSSSSQPQVTAQPNLGSVFANSPPSHSQVSSPSNAGGVFVNSVPSLLQAPSQPYLSSIYGNPLPSQTQVSSEPNFGSIYENSVPSQPQVYSQPNLVSNDSQNTSQLVNQTQSALDPSFTDFDLSWGTPTSHSNQPPLADNSLPQIVAPTDEPLLEAEIDGHCTGSTNPGSLEFQFDSWIMDNQPISTAFEVSGPSCVNVLSPDPDPVDSAGIFFQF